MREIEKVLAAVGAPFCHAAVSQQRCHSGSAYSADSVVCVGRNAHHREFLLRPTEDVAFVECGLAGFEPVLCIDHHNPGDAGFDKGPADYLQGSSLAQVLNHYGLEPTETQRLLCAADHCLTAAYQGECPGVDPDELLFMRASWQALMTYRSMGDTLTSILAAAKAVNQHYDPAAGMSIFLDPTRTPADLPEGAARAGKAVRYRSLSLDGVLKEMVKGGTPAQLAAFIAEHEALGRRTYGNPYRGYAGAYLT